MNRVVVLLNVVDEVELVVLVGVVLSCFEPIVLDDALSVVVVVPARQTGKLTATRSAMVIPASARAPSPACVESFARNLRAFFFRKKQLCGNETCEAHLARTTAIMHVSRRRGRYTRTAGFFAPPRGKNG